MKSKDCRIRRGKLSADQTGAERHMGSSASSKLQRSRVAVSGRGLGEAAWAWYRRATGRNGRTSCYRHEREKSLGHESLQPG
jgi:hypothetical protein